MMKPCDRLSPATSPLKSLPVLTETRGGWRIDLQDAAGVHVMSSAVYPSKYLAEEALTILMQRSA